MLKSLSKLPEYKILAYLGIIALSWHLFTAFSSILALFTDIFLILLLAWILAFIIEPLVLALVKKGVGRNTSAIIVYIALSSLVIGLIVTVTPTIVSQLSQLSNVLPSYIPQNPIWSTRVERFLTGTLENSVTIASQLASLGTGLLLVFILSFYFLTSRKAISKFILDLIPDKYEEDYTFFEHTINTTFASFLRVQVVLGLITGFATLITLWILRVDYALSTAALSAILAMIPVAGSVLFLIPPLLAALIISPQKLLVVAAVLILLAQLIYNIIAPRLLGKALQIHPIIVLISFLAGYKIAGISGAIFAVPIISALAIIAKDIIKYWRAEADKS